jgi:hypothetical protein
MGRGMQIAVCGAVVAGSVGGGLAALHSSSRPVTPPSTGSTVAPTTPPPPTPPGSPGTPPPAAQVLLAMQMKTVLVRFVEWSRNHVGAPCPDGAALGIIAIDPWGHPITLTCTDQPADQRVGARSAGPDGVVGNGDDVASWSLGKEVTDQVRGARWTQAPAISAAPSSTKPPIGQRGKQRSHAHGRGPAAPTPLPTAPLATPSAPARPTKPGAQPLDAGADDIPGQR